MKIFCQSYAYVLSVSAKSSGTKAARVRAATMKPSTVETATFTVAAHECMSDRTNLTRSYRGMSARHGTSIKSAIPQRRVIYKAR